MEYDKKVINRLKRIEGQLKGVLGMVDKEKIVEILLFNYLPHVMRLTEQWVSL